MSILVKNTTKINGKQKALNDVSFEIKSGEIVGFLGPNGAGKSTMMKIITGFIPPTSGEVLINGLDVVEHSLEVKKLIGYLPENNPLYLDMYVKEYLGFIAGIYKIGKGKRERVDELVKLTGLEQEQHKKIGALSKGYRQRVGLAQALIHDPDVLILDEPTSGLDPNQIIEIRNLISDIGKKKTVMLSTHIMQEVEAICNRIIIIKNGEIVANDSTETIINKTPGKQQLQTVVVEFNTSITEKKLMRILEASKVVHVKDNQWLIQSESTDDLRPNVFDFAVKNNLQVLSMQKQEKSLEDIFRDLTEN